MVPYIPSFYKSEVARVPRVRFWPRVRLLAECSAKCRTLGQKPRVSDLFPAPPNLRFGWRWRRLRSVRFGLKSTAGPLGSARFGAEAEARFDTERSAAVRFGSVRRLANAEAVVRFGSARWGTGGSSVRFGSALVRTPCSMAEQCRGFGFARFGASPKPAPSVRPGSAIGGSRLGSVRFGFPKFAVGSAEHCRAFGSVRFGRLCARPPSVRFGSARKIVTHKEPNSAERSVRFGSVRWACGVALLGSVRFGVRAVRVS